MRVVIVDGSARIRARIAERMREEGAHVDEAAALSTVIVALASSPPDVVILDLHLDDVGIAGVMRVRQAAPTATIVVLTNEVDEIHSDECTRHGADLVFDMSRDFDRAVELVLGAAKEA